MIDRAYLDLVLREERLGNVWLATVAIGHLHVTTGRLVACDPKTAPWPVSPFVRRVPVGQFPVSTVYVGSFWDAEDDAERCCALVRFSSEPIVHWEEARFESAPDEERGYFSGGHKGCFADVELLGRLGDRALFAGSSTVFDGSLEPDGPTSANIVHFEPGWYRGPYFSYFGLSASGAPVVCVTDFGIARQAREFLLRGPWGADEHRPDDDPLKTFSAFVRAHNCLPDAAWIARYLRDGDLQDLWSHSVRGRTLLEYVRNMHDGRARQIEEDGSADLHENDLARRVRAVAPRAPSLDEVLGAFGSPNRFWRPG